MLWILAAVSVALLIYELTTLIGSVLRSIRCATSFSGTGSLCVKVRTVASAAAAQLVSHF